MKCTDSNIPIRYMSNALRTFAQASKYLNDVAGAINKRYREEARIQIWRGKESETLFKIS